MGWGVRQNAKRAKDLYRSAASVGNEQAKRNLKRLAQAQAEGDARKLAEEAAEAGGTVGPDGQVRITVEQ